MYMMLIHSHKPRMMIYDNIFLNFSNYVLHFTKFFHMCMFLLIFFQDKYLGSSHQQSKKIVHVCE